MKTFEQLAESAYNAYRKQAGGKTFDGRLMPDFSVLGEKVTANWVAAVQQVAAEIAAIH